MSIIGENFADDIKITKYQLEDSCARQAEIYWFYAEKLAQNKVELDIAKQDLDNFRARLELKYRQNPPDGIKITESTISALIEGNVEITEKKGNISSIQEKIYYLQAALTTLDHRKAELDNLVQLCSMHYFNSKWEDNQEKIHASLNKETM